MNDIINEKKSFHEKNVTDKDLLIFAKWILFIVFALFILGCISELIWKGNMVFEICKTILPSFATLIIGYYFGKD